MSLRFRVILSFGAILGVTAAIVLLLLSFIVKKEVARTVKATSQRTLKVLASQIESRQKLLDQGISFLADRPGTRSLGDTDTATINDHLKSIHGLIGADWMAFIDSDGKVKGRSHPILEIGAEPKSYLGINAAREGKNWQGAFFKQGKVFLVATHPILIGGFVKGILVGGTEVDQAFATAIGAASSAEVEITYQGQKVAASFDGESHGDQSGERFATLHGAKFLGASSQVTPLGLTESLVVTALVPEKAMTAPFDSIWRVTGGAFAAAILGALVLAGYLALGVTRPVDMLVGASKMLQDGNWPEAFDTTRRDELGFLMGAFDQMSSGLRKNQEELLKLLEVDPLTHLWNQRSFRDKLDAALARAIDERDPFSLVILDLDHFGDYNLAHGGHDSDELLVQVANLLRNHVGEKDVCGRLNADEFVILTYDASPAELAERLRIDINCELGVTASLGVAHFDDENPRSDLLLLAAKMAKDTAKQGGRNRVRVFETFAAAGDLKELKQFLQNGSYAAMRALAEAVDAKDEYTRGHSTRVADYARDLAELMGLDAGFVELVHVSGTLHDVGKIGVPDSVLKKTDKLTDEEFEEIKKHPALGEKIVGQLPMLKDALPGVRHHHERWDGKGYPDQLAGEDIPLLARILAVADTYDAMTSDRPYRKGMPVAVARRIMLENSGTQFDPALLPVFEAWLDRAQTLAA